MQGEVVLKKVVLFTPLAILIGILSLLSVNFLNALMEGAPTPQPLLILSNQHAKLETSAVKFTEVNAVFSHDANFRNNVLELKFPDGGALVAHFRGELPAPESSLAYSLDGDDGEFVIYQPFGIEYAPKYSNGEIDLRISNGWYVFTLPTPVKLLVFSIKF